MLDPSILRRKKVTISDFAKLEGMMENDKNVATLVLKTDKANWLVIPKTADGRYLSFISAKDEESLKRHRRTI